VTRPLDAAGIRKPYPHMVGYDVNCVADRLARGTGPNYRRRSCGQGEIFRFTTIYRFGLGAAMLGLVSPLWRQVGSS